MKRQLGPWSLDALFAHDEQQIAFGEDADSRRINPRHVDDDFDRLVPLAHRRWRGAFSRERLRRQRAAAELVEDPANIFRKVGGFRGDGYGRETADALADSTTSPDWIEFWITYALPIRYGHGSG